jgi:FkbM family methyltransferase
MCWLDWDNALSILGHDIEIKKTYTALIASDQRPTRFVDVGANYGMHSILFLSAGIPILAFEPNPNCYTCFKAICELNDLRGKWEQVAVGNENGMTELVYPEKETWLGSISKELIPELKKRGSVIVQVSPLRKLDDYLGDISSERVLIKIDAEGSELEVIKGAEKVIEACRPKLIFESNDASKRLDLHCLLKQFDYGIYPLPWNPSVPSASFQLEEFLANPLVNFIAVANEH